MLQYIKNSLPAKAVKQTTMHKGERLFEMKDGTCYSETFFNGSKKPVYVRTRRPLWLK